MQSIWFDKIICNAIESFKIVPPDEVIVREFFLTAMPQSRNKVCLILYRIILIKRKKTRPHPHPECEYAPIFKISVFFASSTVPVITAIFVHEIEHAPFFDWNYFKLYHINRWLSISGAVLQKALPNLYRSEAETRTGKGIRPFPANFCLTSISAAFRAL